MESRIDILGFNWPTKPHSKGNGASGQTLTCEILSETAGPRSGVEKWWGGGWGEKYPIAEPRGNEIFSLRSYCWIGVWNHDIIYPSFSALLHSNTSRMAAPTAKFPALRPADPQGSDLLAAERARASFSINDLGVYMYGEEWIDRLNRILEILENDPAMDKSKRYYSGRDERFQSALWSAKRMVELQRWLVCCVSCLKVQRGFSLVQNSSPIPSHFLQRA